MFSGVEIGDWGFGFGVWGGFGCRTSKVRICYIEK